MCVYLCVSACKYFISSSLQFLPTAIIQTDLPTIATTSGVIPQDLLIRKCDHRGCKIVRSGYSLIHILLDSAFTIRPLKHGLRSLPHLQNVASALFGWWQVGGWCRTHQVQLFTDRKKYIWGNTTTADPMDGSLRRTRLHLPR